MRYLAELVLDELRAVWKYEWVTDQPLRAFHVRFFRGRLTPDEIRGLSLGQISTALRKLVEKGYLVKAHRTRAEYRPTEATG